MIQIDNNSEDLLDNMNAVILTMSPVLHFFARVLCLRRIAFRKDIIAILASLTSFAKNKNGIFAYFYGSILLLALKSKIIVLLNYVYKK